MVVIEDSELLWILADLVQEVGGGTSNKEASSYIFKYQAGFDLIFSHSIENMVLLI